VSVTLVGQEGFVLEGAEDGYHGNTARLEVLSKGICFESMHLPQGVTISAPDASRPGSLTITK